ncbi:alcohol dehydrogenase catalytic domain-containing protein [bacterium]|nr:alcohol dehydrogenase catalytic domain-containing protein [bacterium]
MSVKALQAVGVNKVELTEFSYPQVADDAILLKILYCGICGTDLHGIEGKRTVKFPIIPGHELVAKVVEIGPKALERTKIFSGDTLTVGDMVTINPRITCGKCYYCRNLPQRPEMCMGARTYNSSIGSDKPPFLFGGWAEYMYILPNSEIIKLPEGIDLELASLIEPLACSVGLLDRYRRSHDWVVGDGFNINRNVVVFGVGAIGLLAASCFHLNGARQIICIDALSSKLELAREFGATVTLNAKETSVADRVEAVKEVCQGLGADIVIEACGVPATIGEGVKMLRRGGQLFEVGHLLKAEDARVDANLICRNELEIIGNYAYPSSNCLGYAAEILMQGKLPYRNLIKTYPLDDYREALFGKKDSSIVKSVFAI